MRNGRALELVIDHDGFRFTLALIAVVDTRRFVVHV